MSRVEKPPVLFVCGRDPLDVKSGGGPSYIRSHAAAAMRLGYEPHLFFGGATAGVYPCDFGVVHRVKVRYPGAHYMLRQVSAALEQAVIEFAMEVPNENGKLIIHSFAPWCYTAAKAREGLRKRGVDAAFVASCWSTMIEEKLSQFFGAIDAWRCKSALNLAMIVGWSWLFVQRAERFGYQSADLVLVNYQCIERSLRKLCGPNIRVRKTGYCSEIAITPAKEQTSTGGLQIPSGDAPLIVCVSRHDSRKGVDVLIHALARLKSQGKSFRACLVGGGVVLEQNRRLVKRLGLSGEVTVPGLVESAYAYLRVADVYVLPSRAEQSGSVSMLEAIQAGVAVVASGCDGIPEDITHEQDGLLAEPGNAEDLARQMARVIENSGLRRRLAEAGHETYRRRFSASALERDLGAVYSEVSGVARGR